MSLNIDLKNAALKPLLQTFETKHRKYLIAEQKELLETFLNESDPSRFNYYPVNLHEYLDLWPELVIFCKLKSLNYLKMIIAEHLIDVQAQLMKSFKGKQNLFVKDRIIVNLVNAPALIHYRIKRITQLTQEKVGSLVIYQGTVIRTGEVKALVLQQHIQCSQCERIITVQSELNDYNKLQYPLECINKVNKQKKKSIFIIFMKRFKKDKESNGQSDRQRKQKCGGKKFTPLPGSEQLIDVQEILVQDSFNNNDSTNNRRSIKLVLQGQITNSCKAGDEVYFTGILEQRWQKCGKGQRPIIEFIIDCQEIQLISKGSKCKDIEISSHDQVPLQQEISASQTESRINQLAFQQKLVRSTCPHLFEHYDLKLAILLCLAGGVSSIVDRTALRGNSHILLVGEPGTGKSTILKYISTIAPKSIYTNGIGSTSAGLTMSYIKEGGEWMIEVKSGFYFKAGALVLADQGVCCIDEFNLIQKPQMDSILEALEQQTVSSSKAGLTAKLNARTSVFAACNPVGMGQKYKQSLDIQTNTGLSSPIISRFDLIFVLVDDCSEAKDTENTDFILGKYMSQSSTSDSSLPKHQTQQYSTNDLKQYLAMVREKYAPEVSQTAQKILSTYYIKLRQKHPQISIRSFESFIRLTQAHAKLLQKSAADDLDAISTIILIESTRCQGLGIVQNFNTCDDAQLILQLHIDIKEKIGYDDLDEGLK